MSRETCNVGPEPIVINGVISPIYMEENKWVTGVITLLIGAITPSITGRAPPCACTVHFGYQQKEDSLILSISLYSIESVCIIQKKSQKY